MSDYITELNRIAATTGKDQNTAASLYAGLTYVTDDVHALNLKNGTHYLDLPAVLSALAGVSLRDAMDAIVLVEALGSSSGFTYLLESSGSYLLEDGSKYLLE